MYVKWLVGWLVVISMEQKGLHLIGPKVLYTSATNRAARSMVFYCPCTDALGAEVVVAIEECIVRGDRTPADGAVVITGGVYKDMNGNGDHPGCVVDRGDNRVPRVLVDGGRSGGIIVLRVSVRIDRKGYARRREAVHTAFLVSLRVAYFVK